MAALSKSPNPLISFVIPTLNAAIILPACLHSIRRQKTSGFSIEIIIADGGSTDGTQKIAHKFKAKIVHNPLKTAESGKAIGAKHAKGAYIALIDSDNLLPSASWLSVMLKPFNLVPSLIATEPIKFTYRRQAGFIERYSALFGANDPYAFVCGITDRQNFINFRWTSLKLAVKDYPDFLLLTLIAGTPLPTLGANGTIYRASFLKKLLTADYLFDIDIISQYLIHNSSSLLFAKVKIGIIHTFCESSITKFIRKQNRRLVDYYYYQPLRSFNWGQANSLGIVKFTLYSLTILPSLFDSLRGYFHRPDPAWFFHPLACLLSWFIYTKVTLAKFFHLLKPVNRLSWRQ
ncbi:MAG: glycosyltransferase family 2 protein [Candidatus Shapirobacteria bacterium]|jgi:glycosyltransferase involved in cell wall biosynthesis